MTNEELEDAFPKATLGSAKKGRTVQYRTAEPCLINADHEIAEKDGYCGHLKSAIAITRDKSLETIKIYKAPSIPTPPKLISQPLTAKKYPKDKFNISDNRMTIEGCGSKKPIADNWTKEGRARTVEFRVVPQFRIS